MMIRGLDQDWVVPPHWRARRRQVMLGMMRRALGRSRRVSFWRIVVGEEEDSSAAAVAAGTGGLCVGSRNPTAMNSSAIAERGRLIPKQARQEKRSMRAPPSGGALTSAMDWMPLTMANQRGRFCKGKSLLRMVTAPLEMPAEARPERARPKMKVREVGARVQIREARAKRAVEVRKMGFSG